MKMSEVVKFAEMTDEVLKEIALGCHEVINVYGQVSLSDLNSMEGATRELAKRGYEVFEVPRLVIQKPEEEELAIPRPEPGEEHLVRRRLVQSEEEH